MNCVTLYDKAIIGWRGGSVGRLRQLFYIGERYILGLIAQNPYAKVRIIENRKGFVMPTATLTSKGQITIPLAVRTALGLDAGDRVEFIETGDGQFSIVAATQSVQALKGMIRRPEKPVTVEEMNAAIAKRGAAAK